MEWVLPLCAYLVGYAIAFRRMAGQLAWHYYGVQQKKYPILYEGKRYPDGEQWFGAILCALLLSIFWPVTLPMAHGLSVAKITFGSSMFYTPPNQRERLYKERISELEREVGIR